MPWLPDVHALDVGIRRPLAPKKMPMLAAAVCGIMRTYEFAFSPLVSLMRIILAKSAASGGLPVHEPQATPVAPLAITASPVNPASAIASSADRTASCDTRPMLRNCLRVQ